MKLLRHGPLTFWLAVFVLFASVVLTARSFSDELPPPTSSARADLVASYRQSVSDLVVEFQSGLADLGWVQRWAKESSAFAARAERESAPEMAAGWREAAAAADELGGLTELDSQAAVRAVLSAKRAADRLAGLASGITPQPTP